MSEKIRIVGREILGGNLEFFSLRQIVKQTQLDRLETRRALERLWREKFIRIYRITPARQLPEETDIVYKVHDRKGLEAWIAPKLRNETAQDRMWKVIRYLRVFTRSDLIRTAGVKRENAKWFTKMLHRAGIIRPSKEKGPGVEWALIKDCGPKRPFVGPGRKAHSA
jgi:hypothetical protein